MDTAIFNFHGELNDFLPRSLRAKPVQYEFDWRASVKDMIESIAPPHCEVEAITANLKSVNFDYIVAPDDHIHVYDYTSSKPIKTDNNIGPIKPDYAGKPRFILDTHLGRLASYLRMMGFDTLYRNDYPDDELADVSHHENRILLTRDLGLLKRSLVIHGRFVRSTNPQQQVVEIVNRYGLQDHVQPFLHCTKCNGIVQPVEKDTVSHKLTDRTLQFYDEFHQCQNCAQVYWKGSHYQHMLSFMGDIFSDS